MQLQVSDEKEGTYDETALIIDGNHLKIRNLPLKALMRKWLYACFDRQVVVGGEGLEPPALSV